MTSPPLISSVEASPARTSHRLAVRLASPQTPGVDCFMSSPESLAWYDPESSCWRTSLPLLAQMMGLTSPPFSGSWPRSGMMVGGTVYPLPPLAPLTAAIDGSSSALLPTPSANDHKGSSRPGQRRGQLSEVVAGAILNPAWVERLMGFPDGWTDLEEWQGEE